MTLHFLWEIPFVNPFKQKKHFSQLHGIQSILPNQEEDRGDAGFFQPDSLISVLETAGKSGTAKISLPKKPTEAFKMNFTGHTLDKLEIQDSSVSFPYGPKERCVVGVSYRLQESSEMVAGSQSESP